MSDAGSTVPEFVTLEEAAAMTTGTRVTFIPGIPALYAEALKNICFVKGVPLVRALHPMMGVDKETGEDRQARLYELTSQTSIPTMFHDEERPRNVWIEQLGLAERIGAPGTFEDCEGPVGRIHHTDGVHNPAHYISGRQSLSKK